MSNSTNVTYPAYDLQAIANYQYLGYLDLAFMSEIIAVNLVALALVIIFRNREPLKSRGIIPVAGLFLLLIANIARLCNDVVPTIVIYSLVPVQLGAITIVWAALVIQWLRYRIKQQRELAKVNAVENVNATTFQKIINFAFVSNLGLFIYILVVGFCMGLIMMGVWLSIFVTNTFAVTVVVVIVVLIVIEVFTASALVIVDMIVDVYRYGIFTGTFSVRDPLNFKVDGLFLLACCTTNALYLIFNQVSGAIVATEGLTTKYVGLYAPTIFLDHAQRWLLILLSGGSCCFIIIKRFVIAQIDTRRNSKNLSRTELMLRIWNMEEGRKAIIKYCEAEFSVENCKAYEDLQKYKEIKDPEEKTKFAHTIYNTYIFNSSSLLLVNMSQACKTKITENMMKLPTDTSVLEGLFEDFEIEVRGNLQDTFGRFMFSEAYGKYKRRGSSFDRNVKA